MTKGTKASWCIVIACVLGTAGNLFAQDDHLIENQRTNVVENAVWGDTYIGKYTSGNVLSVSTNATLTSKNGYVGVSDLASTNIVEVADGGTWTLNSLQIGSENNGTNLVYVRDGGEIILNEVFVVNGVSNMNGFLIGSNGTLSLKSDFSMNTEGFYYDSTASLRVSGEFSGTNSIEEGLTVLLDGESSSWKRTTNTAEIGALTDHNGLVLENGASLAFTDLLIGGFATSNNQFTVSSGSKATVSSNLFVFGTNNFINMTGGELVAEGSLLSESTLLFDSGGLIQAHGTVTTPGIDGSGTLKLQGEDAFLNRNGLSLSVAGGSSLEAADSAKIVADSVEVSGSSSISMTDSSELTTGNIDIDGGSVAVGDSAKLIIEGDGSVLSAGSTLAVEDGGWITFASPSAFTNTLQWDPDGSFYWASGGAVEFQGGAPIPASWFTEGEDSFVEYGTLFIQDGRQFIVSSSNGYWDAQAHNLHVGDLSGNNTLKILDGAQAAVKSMSIGDFKEGGHDNLVVVGGQNTVMTNLGFTTIGGTMISGTWHEGGNNNILRVEDGAAFYSSDTLHNRNTTGTSGLEIASGGRVNIQDYYQANGALLNIYTDSSGINAGLLSVTDTAEFEAGSKVGFDAIATLDIDTTYSNLVVDAGTLIVDGVTNATTGDLSAFDTTGGLLVDYELWVDGADNIWASYTRRYLDGGGDTDSMISEIWSEINRLAEQGNAAASNQLQIVDDMDSEEEWMLQMEQLYAYQLPTYMHNRGVLGGIDQVRARGSSFHGTSDDDARPKPGGAAGPHAEDQGLQGWAKVYGSFGNRDEDGGDYVDGYDMQAYGTVIGLDQAFGEWLFGLAGGYTGSNLEGDNGDESDATTGYGILYANYGTKDWFGDLALSYGLTDMDNTSGTDFDATSSVEASQTAFYIGGGKEYKDPDSDALLRPMLGLQISQFDQDAYTEESNNAVVKDVEAYDRWSYQSILGASMILPKAGTKVDLETQLRAFWLHEFNDDEEKVGYTLVDTNQPGQFTLRSPDQNVGQFGIGCVADWKNGWQLRADLDGQISKTFYSATVSGALLYEF